MSRHGDLPFLSRSFIAVGWAIAESVPVFSPPSRFLATLFYRDVLNTIREQHVGVCREIRENGTEWVAMVMGCFLSRFYRGGWSGLNESFVEKAKIVTSFISVSVDSLLGLRSRNSTMKPALRTCCCWRQTHFFKICTERTRHRPHIAIFRRTWRDDLCCIGSKAPIIVDPWDVFVAFRGYHCLLQSSSSRLAPLRRSKRPYRLSCGFGLPATFWRNGAWMRTDRTQKWTWRRFQAKPQMQEGSWLVSLWCYFGLDIIRPWYNNIAIYCDILRYIVQ